MRTYSKGTPVGRTNSVRSGVAAKAASFLTVLLVTPICMANTTSSLPSIPEVFEESLYVEKAAVAGRQMSAEFNVEQLVFPGEDDAELPGETELGTWDPALDDGSGALRTTSPDQFINPNPSFEGINATQTGFNPPDTQGDVGPNHYIQAVNSSFEIWDKDGNSLTGPTQINLLWAGVSDAQAECRDSNSGDPVVLYDHLADRWVITKFTRPDVNWQCIAVSQGPDPVNDGWYLYQFFMTTEGGAPFSNDYPKFGVWPDGYYMGSQTGFSGGNLHLLVYDRANMLNGNPATSQTLDGGGNPAIFWLPADLDGTPPPAGTPNYFARQVDSDYYGVGGNDRVEIVEFSVDWADPSNTSLSAIQTINVADFDSRLCGGGNPGLFQYCIPQPGVTSLLEALTVWPMMQLQYRNHGNRDTLVFNHTVNADGNGTAGIRWYELERDTVGTGNWTLRQQGTYAPQFPGNSQPEHRFMGSAAMDRFGNIAIGYSVSSTNLTANGDLNDGFPSIRYTGRQDDAPLGLMPETEVTTAQGTMSRNEDAPGGDNQVRWGDYSAMVVDPVDNCTFWYTQEYLTLANNAWSTRISAFSFADCSANLSVTKSANPDPATAGQQITYTITVSNAGPLDATNVEVTDTLPAGLSYVADSLPGNECSDTTEPIISCNVGDLAAGSSTNFTITAEIAQDILQSSNGPSAIDNSVEVSSDQNDADTSDNSYTLSTLVNESADLEVEKICKPDEPAIAGEETGECEIFVTNNGISMARNVVLVDEIFSNGNYNIDSITTDPPGLICNQSEGDVECDLGDMDAGDVYKVTVVVSTDEAIDINDLATVSSDTPDPDTSNNSATGSITFIVATADVVVTKQCQPITPAPAGSDGFCEIFVYNNGPSVAEDVQLSDQIASDGDYDVTAITTTAGNCSSTGTNVDVTCDLNDIAVNDTVTVVVTFTTNDEVDVDDIATATSVTQDPDPNNNSATGSVSFTGIADLSITKTDNGASVTAGTSLTYVLDVANAGPSAATNVVVTDIIPADSDVLSAAVTIGSGSCVVGVAGDPLQPTECGLGEIAPGDPAQITIEVFVGPGATGTLFNDAIVSSDTYDADNSNNRATESTPIVVDTDLVLTKTADMDPVAAGSELKYTLRLVNNGPSTATDTTLVDNLPPETTWVKTKVLGGVGDCVLSSANPDVVTCTLNDMEPGEIFLVVITVLVDPSTPDGTDIINNATATESGEPSLVDASVTVTVNAEADLWIDKTGLFLTDIPSRTIRYTLTVHNDGGCSGDDPQVCGNGGPSDAQNVVVIDDLPATNRKLRVTFVSEDCTYDYDLHEVTCITPTLAAGDTVYHEIEARPIGNLRAITNYATVSSDTTDPNLGNNEDEWLIVVGGGGNK